MARMTVTFDDDLHYEITRLAALQGRTKSSLINEFMGASIPAMRNISSIIEHLRSATEAEKQAFKQGLDDLAHTAQTDVERLQSQMDIFTAARKLKLV